jgi:hypothetical protein
MVSILKVSEAKNRIQIRIPVVRIRRSESVSKSHGSGTLVNSSIPLRFETRFFGGTPTSCIVCRILPAEYSGERKGESAH